MWPDAYGWYWEHEPTPHWLLNEWLEGFRRAWQVLIPKACAQHDRIKRWITYIRT